MIRNESTPLIATDNQDKSVQGKTPDSKLYNTRRLNTYPIPVLPVPIKTDIIHDQKENAQNVWKRSYSQPFASWANAVFETYDKGYLTGGMIRNQLSPYYGYILKTDINGNKLWEKVIDGTRESEFMSINITSDGGFLAGGMYNNMQGFRDDAYVIKFNACAEPEWCSIIPDDEHGLSTYIHRGSYETPDGGYLVHRNIVYGPPEIPRWSIAKLSSSGNLEWLNNYIYTNPDWFPASQIQMRSILTSDTCMLVCGMVFDTIAYNPPAESDMPFWYKVDINGNLLWDKKWNCNASNSNAEVFNVTEGCNKSYYSGGIMNPGLGLPYIMKISHNGDSIARYPIHIDPTSIVGKPHLLKSLNDTTLIIGGSFAHNTTDGWMFLQLSDTLGNKKVQIVEEALSIPVAYCKTFDNKIVISGLEITPDGTFPSYWISLSKFNTNLEYDSIYPAPRTYDYLCQHPIVSDTIPMPGNCRIVTALHQFKRAEDVQQLTVYPNPATTYTTVEVPEYTFTVTKGVGITQQQYRPLIGEVQITLMNLNGKIVKTDTFDASERNHVVAVNKLPSGLYVMHLTQQGKFVAQGRVMVVR